MDFFKEAGGSIWHIFVEKWVYRAFPGFLGDNYIVYAEVSFC